MEKQEEKFLKDYSQVLKYSVDKSVSDEKICNILTTPEYYNDYIITKDRETNNTQAFLYYFQNKFDLMMEKARAEKRVIKSSLTM